MREGWKSQGSEVIARGNRFRGKGILVTCRWPKVLLEGVGSIYVQRLKRLNILDMNKLNIALLLALCFALTACQTKGSNFYSTPVAVPKGKTTVTLFDVWPEVDKLLKTEYWYYLRNANTIYEASVDTKLTYLYFTIYRNIVGTFLVITTWTKDTQTTQINTFVRLGNGFEAGSGANYDPVNIDPFIVSLELGPDEYMVVVNADGTITVTGNLDLYNQAMGLTQNGGAASTFNITADMAEKCAIADQLNKEKYWYYLDKSEKVSENNIPTSLQYYCVFVYVNVVGTFLSISHYDLESKSAGINTFVRLGNGKAEGANYGPVTLTPAVLHLDKFE
jgi:hypothetical protein